MADAREGEALYFVIGDYLVGALGGVLVAAVVRCVVSPSWDMVAAMMVGMTVGMLVQVAACMAFAALFGMFETMVPGMLIGMYGGMLFAMRDSMHGEVTRLPEALAVAALLGVVVVGGMRVLDARLRGVVFERPPATEGGEQ